MNERIRDLFEDAGGYYADFEDDGNFQFVLPDLEKFTELIVRECIAMADEFEIEVNRSGLVDRMKEHFGVEK